MDPNQARDLILSGKAPEPLSVDGFLNCECTSLTTLPRSLSVYGPLFLDGCTNLTHLPESLTVGGALDIRGCTSLRNLAGDIKGSIFCDPEFVDQIDWPLFLSYIPHLEPEVQAMIEKKLRHGS